MRRQVASGINVAQHPQMRDAMGPEVPQRVRHRVFARPAGVVKWLRRPPRTQRHQPVAAVLGWSKDRVMATQCAESLARVGGVGVGDVAADDGDAAPAEPPAGGVHALADIASALRDAPDFDGQAVAGAIGGQRQDGAEAALAQQAAQQADQRPGVKAQRRPLTDVFGQPALHGSQTRRAGEYDDRVLHP